MKGNVAYPSLMCQGVSFNSRYKESASMKMSIPCLIMVSILLVFILEVTAISVGMNGQCIRMAIGAICMMAGFIGGWGIKKAVFKKKVTEEMDVEGRYE